MYNEDCQTVFPQCERIIAIGDVHGDLERLLECLYTLRIVDTNGVWIAEPKNTMVVQLGDQVDSRTRAGDDGWERLPDYEVLYFMDKLDRQARLHGGRVISLLGNHEIMNTQGDFTYVSEKSMDPLRRDKFAPGSSICQLLARRCVIVKIGDILFVHGGLLPYHVDMFQGNIHNANTLIRKYLRNEPRSPEENNALMHGIIGDNGILWTRVYTQIAVDQSTLTNVLHSVLVATNAKMICTGHNTMQHITPISNGMLWFLDAGFSRAYGTNRCQVLEILYGNEFKIIELQFNNKN